MSIKVGQYEPNIDTGLLLPVVRLDSEKNEFMNMELVASHYRVDCGEETDEMKQWIGTGWLIKIKSYVSDPPIQTEESKEISPLHDETETHEEN